MALTEAEEQAVRGLIEMEKTRSASLSDDMALLCPALYPEWNGKGVAYVAGERLTYQGTVYKVSQDHVSQEQYPPGAGTESLYTSLVLSSDGIPVWKQPTGAHDAYNTGDKVHYPDESGPVYISKIDGNSWSPDTYPAGWELSE